MAVDTPSLFSRIIQDHLELKRRNASLEHEMPIERYMTDDPFVNHPLFKTEQQARIEDTMDGAQSIVEQPTSLHWPTTEDTFIDEHVQDTPDSGAQRAEDADPDQPSDENLWSRSRDFDWGD